MNFLAATESNGGMGIGFWVVYIVIIVAFMYFLMIRPQKRRKEGTGSSVLQHGNWRQRAYQQRFLRRNHRHHRRYGDRRVRQQQELPYPDAKSAVVQIEKPSVE